MIDYEAATKELTEWLAEQEGITDIADAARSVVDAALGDAVLYEEQGYSYRGTLNTAMVQVWPVDD